MEQVVRFTGSHYFLLLLFPVVCGVMSVCMCVNDWVILFALQRKMLIVV